MRFAVVTSFFNAENFVKDTITSVITQEGLETNKFELDYVVWDACSTDSSLAFAQKALKSNGKLISKKDNGLYDGLSQAFKEVNGDVYFYLNAGDLLLPGSLLKIYEYFSSNPDGWVCGNQLLIDSSGEIFKNFKPPRFKKTYIRKGMYGRILPPIQQESTFWAGSLMAKVDLEKLKEFKLAGDFYLWHTFSNFSELEVIDEKLAGFRVHEGQLSENMESYRTEIEKIAGKLSPFDVAFGGLEKILWKLHNLKDRPELI